MAARDRGARGRARDLGRDALGLRRAARPDADERARVGPAREVDARARGRHRARRPRSGATAARAAPRAGRSCSATSRSPTPCTRRSRSASRPTASRSDRSKPPTSSRCAACPRWRSGPRPRPPRPRSWNAGEVGPVKRVLRLYDYLESGNGYKVRLLLTQLGVAVRARRARHPAGRDAHARVPAPQPERPHSAASSSRTARTCAESNAIQFYLAEGTPFLPGGPARARAGAAVDVLRAVQPRALHRGRALLAPRGHGRRRSATSSRRSVARGYAALGVMETHLRERALLRRRALLDRRHRALRLHARGARGRLRSGALSRPSRAWLARVRAQPRHVPITRA